MISVPLLGVAIFGVSFAIHWLVWVVRRPLATAKALVLLLVSSTLVLAVVLYAASVFVPALRTWLPSDIGAWAQATLLALAIAASYAMTYPAVEVESPTLLITEMIARSAPAGVGIDELHMTLNDDFLVMDRVNDLRNEGVAEDRDGRYVLTSGGRRLAQIFMVWRRLNGLGHGG